MRHIPLFVIDQANEVLDQLEHITREQQDKGIKNSTELQLLKSITKKNEILKENPEYGDKISNQLWPKGLAEKYSLTNLWRVELTGYWRMLYTLSSDSLEVTCFVIDISDHKRYDRLFGYRKR